MKIILDYCRWVLYNVLETVSGALNTLLALVYIHSYISWGTDYLAVIESHRINKEVDARVQKRDFMALDAELKADEAKKEMERARNE